MPASATPASTVPEEYALLVASFAEVTDPRFARGKVHPLPGGLAQPGFELMAGAAYSVDAIATVADGTLAALPIVAGPPMAEAAQDATPTRVVMRGRIGGVSGAITKTRNPLSGDLRDDAESEARSLPRL